MTVFALKWQEDVPLFGAESPIADEHNQSLAAVGLLCNLGQKHNWITFDVSKGKPCYKTGCDHPSCFECFDCNLRACRNCVRSKPPPKVYLDPSGPEKTEPVKAPEQKPVNGVPNTGSETFQADIPDRGPSDPNLNIDPRGLFRTMCDATLKLHSWKSYSGKHTICSRQSCYRAGVHNCSGCERIVCTPCKDLRPGYMPRCFEHPAYQTHSWREVTKGVLAVACYKDLCPNISTLKCAECQMNICKTCFNEVLHQNKPEVAPPGHIKAVIKAPEPKLLDSQDNIAQPIPIPTPVDVTMCMKTLKRHIWIYEATALDRCRWRNCSELGTYICSTCKWSGCKRHTTPPDGKPDCFKTPRDLKHIFVALNGSKPCYKDSCSRQAAVECTDCSMTICNHCKVYILNDSKPLALRFLNPKDSSKPDTWKMDSQDKLRMMCMQSLKPHLWKPDTGVLFPCPWSQCTRDGKYKCVTCHSFACERHTNHPVGSPGCFERSDSRGHLLVEYNGPELCYKARSHGVGRWECTDCSMHICNDCNYQTFGSGAKSFGPALAAAPSLAVAKVSVPTFTGKTVEIEFPNRPGHKFNDIFPTSVVYCFTPGCEINRVNNRAASICTTCQVAFCRKCYRTHEFTLNMEFCKTHCGPGAHIHRWKISKWKASEPSTEYCRGLNCSATAEHYEDVYQCENCHHPLCPECYAKWESQCFSTYTADTAPDLAPEAQQSLVNGGSVSIWSSDQRRILEELNPLGQMIERGRVRQTPLIHNPGKRYWFARHFPNGVLVEDAPDPRAERSPSLPPTPEPSRSGIRLAGRMYPRFFQVLRAVV